MVMYDNEFETKRKENFKPTIKLNHNIYPRGLTTYQNRKSAPKQVVAVLIVVLIKIPFAFSGF